MSLVVWASSAWAESAWFNSTSYLQPVAVSLHNGYIFIIGFCCQKSPSNFHNLMPGQFQSIGFSQPLSVMCLLTSMTTIVLKEVQKYIFQKSRCCRQYQWLILYYGYFLPLYEANKAMVKEQSQLFFSLFIFLSKYKVIKSLSLF